MGKSVELAEGKGAPELTLMDLDDKDVSLSQYKGKVVLVNFWATWCEACKLEIPWLIEMHKKYGQRGLVILGVSMDEEGKSVVAPVVKKNTLGRKRSETSHGLPDCARQRRRRRQIRRPHRLSHKRSHLTGRQTNQAHHRTHQLRGNCHSRRIPALVLLCVVLLGVVLDAFGRQLDGYL